MQDRGILVVLSQAREYLLVVFEKYERVEKMKDMTHQTMDGMALDPHASDTSVSATEFLRFCKDFGVVPLLTLQCCKDIYEDVCLDEKFPSAPMREICLEKGENPTEAGLDFALFQKALCVLSHSIFARRDENVDEQLSSLFGTMACSPGHRIIQEELMGHKWNVCEGFENSLFTKPGPNRLAKEAGSTQLVLRKDDGEDVEEESDADTEAMEAPYGLTGFEIMNVSQVFSYYASCDPTGMTSTTLGMNQWRLFVKDAKLCEEDERGEFIPADADIVFHSPIYRAGPPGFKWSPVGMVDHETENEEVEGHGSELHLVSFMHLMAVVSVRKEMSMSELVAVHFTPLMGKIKVDDIEDPDEEVERIWERYKDFLHPVFNHYSKVRDANYTTMSSARGQRITMKQRNVKRRDRVVGIINFARLVNDFQLGSRAVANSFFRQIMTNVVYGDICDTGQMKDGLDYRGFLLCLGLFGQHKAEHAVGIHAGEGGAGEDRNPEGEARYLLESMAVAPGVGLVERGTIPLKSLNKVVKRILQETTTYRAQTSTHHLLDADHSMAVDAAKHRVNRWNRNEAIKSQHPSGLRETRSTIGRAAPGSPIAGLEESVAVAIEGHPEVLTDTLHELSQRRREAAFHGHLREATYLTETIDQLKGDVAQARKDRVAKEHTEAVEGLQRQLESQLDELTDTWRGKEEGLKGACEEQIAELEERQQRQRRQHEDEAAVLRENVPKAKPPGMSEAIWAQVDGTRKLKPSVALLDLDTKFKRAMSSKRFSEAEALKDKYEALAVREWEEHIAREEKSIARKSDKIEAAHRQEMKALAQRHQQVNDEARQKKEQEFEALNAFCRRRFEELRKISQRCTVVQGGGGLPASDLSDFQATRAPPGSPATRLYM